MCHGGVPSQESGRTPDWPATLACYCQRLSGKVDARLEREFPGRYFRYVDDIALVVERSDVDTSIVMFNTIIGNEGLQPNEDKTDVHPARIWNTRLEKATKRHRSPRQRLPDWSAMSLSTSPTTLTISIICTGVFVGKGSLYHSRRRDHSRNIACFLTIGKKAARICRYINTGGSY